MAITNKEKREGLLTAIKDGVINTCEVIDQICSNLMDCANFLRVEPGEKVFNNLSGLMDNLSDLMEFIRELKGSLEKLEISWETSSSWDRSLDIFKDMLSAFENKDWITLSDLIQYELVPLLNEGNKGLSELKDKLPI